MKSDAITLCIDAGNSALKVGAFADEVLLGQESHFYSDANNVAAWLLEKVSGARKVRCAIACGPLTDRRQFIADLVAGVNGLHDVAWLTSETMLPFAMNYEGKPGADRIANVFALRKLSRARDAAVADFGTSTHFETINAEGNFAGGLIMIGLSESTRALTVATSGVLPHTMPASKASRLRNVFTFSTKDAIGTGLAIQQASAVDRFFREAKSRASNTQFFVTGGNAREVIPALETKVRHVPELTLLGLREFADYRFANK